jgi:hypothetical protein
VIKMEKLRANIMELITTIVQDEVGHTDGEKGYIDHTVDLIMKLIGGHISCLQNREARELNNAVGLLLAFHISEIVHRTGANEISQQMIDHARALEAIKNEIDGTG